MADNNENKVVLNAASCYNRKYFINPEFESLPKEIKRDIQIITVCLAEKLHCVFSMGFYKNSGNVYLEAQAEESDMSYDDIGAALEIEKIQKEETELFKSLQIWYLYNKNIKK